MALALLVRSYMLWFSIKHARPDVVRFCLGGNLDVTTIPDLEPTLDRMASREPLRLELELSRLTMIDTVGVGALVHFAKRLKRAGCLVVVGGLRNQPKMVFGLLGLDRQLGPAPLLPSN